MSEKRHLNVVVDKYVLDSPDVPCAENIRWCRAVCCSFVVHLSPQDLAEGVVAPDDEHPTWNRHGPDGRCLHLQEGKGCGIYEQRPAPCRSYDCRTDKRVWRDYENRIPNPNLDKLFLAAVNVRRIKR